MGENMIPNVGWMVAADVLILWFMSEHRWRFKTTPTVVAENIGISSSHANRRIKQFLEPAGLVELVDDRGYYRITDAGVRTIMGEMTKEELEERDPTEDDE